MRSDDDEDVVITIYLLTLYSIILRSGDKLNKIEIMQQIER